MFDPTFAKENRSFSFDTATMLPDLEFVQEDFGPAPDLKWYLAPMQKPITIRLGGHTLEITHAVIDAQNHIVALPRSEQQGEDVVKRHNAFVEGVDMLSRSELIDHIAMLNKKLDGLVPGRVPRRGPKPKAEKAA
jgi:hypothetical protein